MSRHISEKYLPVRTLCQRLREARELSGLLQAKAADLLGVNAARLNVIEQGVNVYEIPHWLVLKAARAYDVSVDYLYGNGDDFEHDVQVARNRNSLQHLRHEMGELIAGYLSQSAANFQMLEKLGELVRDCEVSIQEVTATFDRFRAANPEFDDSMASAPLLAAVDRATGRMEAAELMLKRLKIVHSASGSKEGRAAFTEDTSLRARPRHLS